MKDYAIEIASARNGLNDKLNALREYLQMCILRIMFQEGIFRSMAFEGGTALRFLYDLPRFSEDLDFSAVKKNEKKFIDIIGRIKEELILEGYRISVSYNDEKIVQHAFIKFADILQETKISQIRDHKLSIKIEVNTSPPAGAVLNTNIVNKYFLISFLSYDIASLFSGKLHALLSRKYTKGRDFFDLGWYLSKWKSLNPNVILLRNALQKTGWKGDTVSEQNWKDLLYKAVDKVKWEIVVEDVKNFLQNPKDINVFTKENILAMIRGQ